jgi:hypothetical protein
MSTDGVKGVPEDFPRGFNAASVPGTQLKFLARKIGDRFVVGLTEDELYERWAFCEDLSQQLAARTLRKQVAGLISDLETFYKETERRVRGQGWSLSEDEVQWLMKRTRLLADEPQ